MIAILSVVVATVAPVYAATNHTISFVTWDGASISSQSIADGSAIGALPSTNDLLVWIDEVGNIVTETTIPTENMTVRAVKTTDVTATGTMDSGNIMWFLADGSLYVTGDGTIGYIPEYDSVNSTKRYGFALGDIEVRSPMIAYPWLTSPSVDDIYNGGYGTFTDPGNGVSTVSLNISRPLAFTGQTISYPHASTPDYAPWSAYASDIKDMTFAETVSLKGNFTLYFNLNSSSVTPSGLKESIYTELTDIYLFADTSGVTRFSGTFARIPKLKGIYVKSGEVFDTSACVDASAMFYGDQLLTCGTKTYATGLTLESIINVFSDTSNIVDFRYMMFGCEELVKPEVGDWSMSSATDISYMFTGCNNAQLTIGESAAAYDIGNWDLSNVFSATGTFAGSNIDITASDPMANLWGLTESSVVTGDINLDGWDLSALQSSVFMFAQNSYITGVQWTSSTPLLVDASAMFAFNPNISTVNMVGLSTPSLEYADTMFFCSGADSATLDATGWDISSLLEAQFMFYNTGFKEINLDNTNPSHLYIGQAMFYGNHNLLSFGDDALADWTLSELFDASAMFYDNPNLRAVDVSGWGMERVASIDYMFANDAALQELDLSNWNTSSDLVSIPCFLNGCSNITSLDLSSMNMSGVDYAFQAFASMLSLTDVNLDGVSFDSLVIGNGMFANDISLEELDFANVSMPMLEDASGMFYECSNLKTLSAKNIVGNSTTNISYILSGASSLETLDISGWDTSSVVYIQGFLDNASSLKTLTLGNSFSTDSALSIAAFMRNCSSLNEASLDAMISKLSAGSLVDSSEAFRGCVNLTSADLSHVNFSNVKKLNRMFYGIPLLVEIHIPDTFLSGVENARDAEGVFFVTDSVLTSLVIDTAQTSVPSDIADYTWNTDNRIFLEEKTCTVNGKTGNSYQFKSNDKSDATLVYDVDSHVILGSTPLTVTYSWVAGSGTKNSTNTYTVANGSVGSYIVTASLADMSGAGSLSKTFSITAYSGTQGIRAIYKGSPVRIGRDFNISDVEVVLSDDDGSSTTLDAAKLTVNSQRVTARGDNLFVVYYTDVSGTLWSADFVVPGYAAIGSISAVYNGPDVTMGNVYNKSDVVVTAYYEDDTEHKNGFVVQPSYFSSDVVEVTGTNLFYVYYNDSSNGNNRLSAQFSVNGVENGVEPKVISSIDAAYVGPVISVGQNYNKEHVIVNLNYTDGTSESVTNFTVNNLVVTKEGANTFVASFMDTAGNFYSDSFDVTGVSTSTSSSGISSISAVYKGSSVKVGSDFNRNDVEVTINYASGTQLKTTNFTLNSTKVTLAGDNTFMATVTDNTGKTYNSNFVVPGWLLANVASIDAVYNGPVVLVGDNYNKDLVAVTIKFSDGTPDTLTADFTVDSTVVSDVGTNKFVAYVVDSYGTTYSDEFLVAGTSNAADISQATVSQVGVKTGDNNSLLILTISLILAALLFVTLLYFRFHPEHCPLLDRVVRGNDETKKDINS